MYPGVPWKSCYTTRDASSTPGDVVADLVAVSLPLKRVLQCFPQRVSCNFNKIEQIFPGAVALRAKGVRTKLKLQPNHPLNQTAGKASSFNPASHKRRLVSYSLNFFEL